MAQGGDKLGDETRFRVVGDAEGAQRHQASLAVRSSEQVACELVVWARGDGIAQVAEWLELAVVTEVDTVHLAEVAAAVAGQNDRRAEVGEKERASVREMARQHRRSSAPSLDVEFRDNGLCVGPRRQIGLQPWVEADDPDVADVGRSGVELA